jgi:hypothetical protein
MTAAATTVSEEIQRVRFDRLRAEFWLSNHLWRLTGFDIQGGATEPSERLARLRKLIAEKGLADAAMGRFRGRPESYRQFVKRALALDLDTPQEPLL